MPKSQMERLWVIGAAFGAFILVVIGYLVMISPQRDQTSQVDAQVATANEQNATLAARISALSAQNKNLSTYENAVKRANAALPATSGIPDFLRTLQAIGNATLTNVSSLTVGAPSAWTAPAAAAPATTTSSSAAPAPATSTGTPAPAAPSIFVMAVTAQVDGSNAHLSEFLRQLQSVQPRAVLVTDVTETDASASGSGASAAPSGSTSLQLKMSVFVAPQAGGAPVTGTP